MKKFFKKSSPKNNLLLTNGSYAKFTTIDQQWGVMETEDPFLLNQFEIAIREQRGGVFEIDEKEYRDLLEKKNRTSSNSWREEWANRPTQDQARTLRGQPEPAPVVEASQPTPVPAGILNVTPATKPRATPKPK